MRWKWCYHQKANASLAAYSKQVTNTETRRSLIELRKNEKYKHADEK